MRLVILLVAAMFAMGCAPSLSQLVADKHYREAICAGVDGYDEDAERVADALAADADVQLHVHRLTNSELARVLGDATPTLTARVELVRVELATNALPVDGYDVRLAVREEMGRYAAAPAGWESLVYATEEKLPPNRTYETYATGDNLLKGLGAVFTVGVSLLFTGGFQPGVVEGAPLPEDYRATAPKAYALYNALDDRACGQSPLGATDYQARRCTTYFVLERQSDARWRLDVEQVFRSDRIAHDGPDEEAHCTVTTSAAVDLHGNGTLASHTRQLFGKRTRPLSSLTR
jgi:hypothetical protein